MAQRKVIGGVRTGAFPHRLRMSPDGREIYVAKAAEVARIPVGRSPAQVCFTPDGTRVYVSLRDEDAVAVIDAVLRGAPNGITYRTGS